MAQDLCMKGKSKTRKNMDKAAETCQLSMRLRTESSASTTKPLMHVQSSALACLMLYTKKWASSSRRTQQIVDVVRNAANRQRVQLQTA